MYNNHDFSYYIHFEITGDPCDLNGCHWCNLFKNGTFFVLSRIFIPSQKGRQPIVSLKKPINLPENENNFCNFLQTSSLMD